MKDRRDDSYGKFGKRDEEHRHTSLEENLRTLDLLAEVGAEVFRRAYSAVITTR